MSLDCNFAGVGGDDGWLKMVVVLDKKGVVMIYVYVYIYKCAYMCI